MVISNSGIEVPGISLIKDFDQAQREYHQAWVAGDTNQDFEGRGGLVSPGPPLKKFITESRQSSRRPASP